MPSKATLKAARRAKRQGKAPTTQAGAFVREEMHHLREGRHGPNETREQAIAIGLAKARKAGVRLGKPPGPATQRRKASAARGNRRRRRASA